MTSHAPSPSLVILISGAGSTMAALLAAAGDGSLGARVAAVVSDKKEAPGLELARAAGVPTAVVTLEDFPSRDAWNDGLARAIDAFAPELVVLAGFMKILSAQTVDHFAGRIINTHPALLPAFPGAHAVRDALGHGVKVTGCTIHIVDSGVDTGPIVAQAAVDVRENDTEAELHERIKAVERQFLVETVRALVTRGWTIEGRIVRLGPVKGDAS